MPAAWRRSWPSCASATARGSATSTSTATSSPRSRRWRPTRPRRRSWRRERERLRHAEGLREAAAGAHAAALGADEDGGGAAGALGRRPKPLLQRVAGVDADLDALAERLSALAVELGDVAGELRDYLDGIEADPGRLAAVEERLDALDRLQRKHGGSVESVLAHAERCRAEIERLEGAEQRGAEAEAALAEAEARREKLGGEAQQGPREGGGAARERGRGGARAAGDAGGAARGRAGAASRRLRPGGRESVELRMAPNPGMEPAPLRDAASGGELSRVMLALSGLGGGAGAGTLVFDEIDAGVGGNTARIVGERLRALGEGRQVLCITHLPQVASLAGDPLPAREGRRRRAAPAPRAAPRRRGRGRGDPPHARRRALRRGGHPPRP